MNLGDVLFPGFVESAIENLSKKIRFKVLKGYRIRIVVDIPIWNTSRDNAIEIAKALVAHSHSASKIIEAKCIKEGAPDNRELFPEDQPPFNPSKRKN